MAKGTENIEKENIEKENIEKERNVHIDIIKGIGIILMVYGHAAAPFKHFIYLFHMAIFFMASGYCGGGSIQKILIV